MNFYVVIKSCHRTIRIARRLKRDNLGVINVFRCLLLIVVLSLSGCFAPKVIQQERILFRDMVENNTEVKRYFLEVDENLEIENRRLFYAAAGDDQKPGLIIIHGTPGSWNQYARYLLNERLREHFYIVVIDRPGWGRSIGDDPKAIVSYKDQATILAALSNQLKSKNGNKPVILMGHSLGSSIAPRVAMDHPESVDGLLLLAGTLSPELSGLRWYNEVAKVPGINWLISDWMRKSNREIIALKGEMDAMAPLWKNVRTYTTVVQGMKDVNVYPENADFAEEALDPNLTEVIRLYEEGHLFPMTRRDDVANWAVDILERIDRQLLACERNEAVTHECS